MEQFPNSTKFGAPMPAPEHLDLHSLHDLTQAGAGAGRSFHPYNPYYPMGYNNTSLGDVLLGVGVFVVVLFVIYWILSIISRLYYRSMYYGYRKKRSAGEPDELATLLTGAIAFLKGEDWRSPDMRRMLGMDYEDELETTVKITEAIEKKSLDYDD